MLLLALLMHGVHDFAGYTAILSSLSLLASLLLLAILPLLAVSPAVTLLQSSLLLLANSVVGSVYATARIHCLSCYYIPAFGGM